MGRRATKPIAKPARRTTRARPGQALTEYLLVLALLALVIVHGLVSYLQPSFFYSIYDGFWSKSLYKPIFLISTEGE